MVNKYVPMSQWPWWVCPRCGYRTQQHPRSNPAHIHANRKAYPLKKEEDE